MHLLILGGTRFVGRTITAAAVQRGHRVTIFNRGRTDPGAFPQVEHLRGDRRAGDLSALGGRRFDAVVDVSGYYPSDVRQTCNLALAPQYTYISTASVYRETAAGADEDAPVHEFDGREPDDPLATPETYGAMKAAGERAVRAAYGDDAFVVRCGLVVGPGDHTERFTYWPRRFTRDGPVLAAEPDQPVQFIDARDLADWVLDGTERDRRGTYNTTGRPLPFSELLRTCAAVARTDPEVVWAGDGPLLEAGLTPWTDMPLWLPAGESGFLAASTDRARAAGLVTRPLEATVADTLAWDAARPEAERRDALSPQREAEILRAGRAPGLPAGR